MQLSFFYTATHACIQTLFICSVFVHVCVVYKYSHSNVYVVPIVSQRVLSHIPVYALFAHLIVS